MQVVARAEFQAHDAVVAILVPKSYIGRPRRGMSALSICWIVRPGLFASRNAWSMVAPVVSPLPALVGTVAGDRPVAAAGGVAAWPLRALRRASGWLVQPTVSKPVVATLFCTPATPTRTPKFSQVPLPSSEPRAPQSSASLLSMPCS